MSPKLILASIGIICAVASMVVSTPLLLPVAVIFVGVSVIGSTGFFVGGGMVEQPTPRRTALTPTPAKGTSADTCPPTSLP